MFLIQSAGFNVTGEATGVDAVVVNTCAFIESAKMEAIETIIELGEAKKEGKIGKIIVAGCLAQRYKDEIMDELPEIDAALGTGSYDEIAELLSRTLEGRERPVVFEDINGTVGETDRIITTSETWAYLKIAEGCDNRCAYCVIPDIRGRYRSRPMENIIKEAEMLARRGIKELIIVAQDVTRYGLDIYGKNRLADLLRALCGMDDLRWIRLHYLYPDEICDELIDVIAENDKIIKYLDIPIQHINDGILQKMNRRGSGREIRELFRRLRERIPGLVLRTSIITGLPGEGDAEFEELCEFLHETRIERAGIFTYSPEEGTAAALMDRPDSEVAARRMGLLVDIQSRIMDDFNKSRIGSVATVLTGGQKNGRYYGRSYAESPDVDGYVWFEGNGARVGDFVDIKITGAEDGELSGKMIVDS